MATTVQIENVINDKFAHWRADWCLFAREVLKVNLDPEQEDILRSVQLNKFTSVASGTSRGKDFVSAVAAICFLYLTPVWNGMGQMICNTKVALTAPTARQVGNIMFPEISRIFKRVGFLPGRLTGYDIRTQNEEWFLTGFKADEHNTEAWTGFHASSVLFVVTEATGIPQSVFDAIEGNLQGNSRLLIVFNPNITTGYAAGSQKSARWNKFRLNSLNATNVIEKQIIYPGQVDYEWIADKVREWCIQIRPEEMNEGEGDFEWEENWYRPNDLFRVKVLGLFPKESSDVLIPSYWIDLAVKRWKEFHKDHNNITQVKKTRKLRLGVDVAGMGRDNSCFCQRYDDYVDEFVMIHSGGVANHMQIAGITLNKLRLHEGPKAWALIDTIGEGAGVFSRLEEQSIKGAISCKYSESAKDDNEKDLNDVTGQYEFDNMRAYLYWAVRDWLNPHFKSNAMLPPDDFLKEELSEVIWKFKSNGKIIIEPKEDIKERLGRSPDKSDALANTFYPVNLVAEMEDIGRFF